MYSLANMVDYHTNRTVKPNTLCIIGHELRTELNNNGEFIRFVTHRHDFINIEYSTDATNIINSNLFTNGLSTQQQPQQQQDDSTGTITGNAVLFVLRDFEGDDFNTLMQNKCSIIGSTCLLQLIMQNKPLYMVPSDRPLHNLAMQDLLITFSGIASKAEAQKLLSLTRWMGAKSREDVTQKTTHLVAGNARGIKYRRAAELGIHIMTPSWVMFSFERRFELEFVANHATIIQKYKQRPFQGLRLAFPNFDPDEVKEMCDLTLNNDGFIVHSSDPSCTHVVVNAVSGDDGIYQQLKDIDQSPSVYIVYREWFWASLEMVCRANEETYAVPGLGTLTRRASQARRSSIGYQSFNNILSPMLDYSRSPDSLEMGRRASRRHSHIITAKSQFDLASITARHRACLELLQTERNYVQVLETIVTLFKLPLENPEQGEPILDATEIKVIFGNLTPIYEVHKRMLKDLEKIIEHEWKESQCIGRIFVNHSMDLLKAYPPFVNFFEDTKKTVTECDNKYPRFHAFLKKCQSKKECGRESLAEMLIRPVQRLPSIVLLITELIKRTDESNPDHRFLKEALERVRQVMNLINEDKRKTEGQIAMFDILNDIEDCPPYLLSANRRFICKAEARLLVTDSDNQIIPFKSHKVVIFLFNDLLEICKLRSLKRSHSASARYGPTRRNIHGPGSRMANNKKQYRHLDELRLEDLKRIYRECQSSELSEVIVIQARPSPKYQNFRTYPFQIDDKEISKDQFLTHIQEYAIECSEDGIQKLVIEENPIPNDEIDFRYSEVLSSSMAKSRLSRVLTIRQTLLSPSVHRERCIYIMKARRHISEHTASKNHQNSESPGGSKFKSTKDQN